MAEDSSAEAEIELSHKTLLKTSKEMLASLLADPFLYDVSLDCGVKDVEGLLALAQGRAITVNIQKFDGGIVSVVVLQGSTVNDLITTFQREVEKEFARQHRTSFISWKYVWRTYCLVQGQTLLTDNKAKLLKYGVGNQSTLHFTKRLKNKKSTFYD